MSKEATIGERIKNLRLKLGLTQEEFALRSGFTRSYLSQLESGVKDGGPKLIKRIIELESEASSPASKSYSFREQTVNASRIAQPRMIALLSWAQGGQATAFEELPETWQERVATTSPDPESFAIELRGDSMEPKYQEGDVITVMPSTFARNGDLVVAKIKEEGFAFKILNLVGGDPNQIRLKSYNGLYEPMDLTREQLHWIYPVHSVTKIIRR